MADMLVRLYRLAQLDPHLAMLEQQGVAVRRAMAYERKITVQWVTETFNDLWAGECATSFGHQPIGCYIAVKDQRIVGFSCLNCTFRNFVGPIGVSPKNREAGIGRALLLACLHEMKMAGYAYAIVGDAGQPAFFERASGAISISDSTPGPYPPKLK